MFICVQSAFSQAGGDPLARPSVALGQVTWLERGPLHHRAVGKDFGLIPGQDTKVAAAFPGGELREATSQCFFLTSLAFSQNRVKILK